jgi:tetratricopeptide (TPR) repeat protein
MEPVTMHLENVLLHVACVILVFLLARRISAYYPDSSPLIPIFSALLFALHPLNVEAVSWIAGRTDPMAALFVLLATLFLIRWLDSAKWRDAALLIFFFLCALLAKETALAFLPAGMLLILGWSTPSEAGQRAIRVKATGAMGLFAILIAALAFLLRGDATAIVRFLSEKNAGLGAFTYNSLIAFGFYVKKIFFPLPLNFAIVKVDANYGLLGGGALLLLAGFLTRRRLSPLLFATAALMSLPAVAVASGHVAWTPYAERYMYLPTALCSLGTCGVLTVLGSKHNKFFFSFMFFSLCSMAFVSRERNLLWKDNLAFYRDAVVKSPDFGAVYNELGTALMQQGKVKEAGDMFAKADRLNKRPSIRMLIKANLMGSMIAKGEYDAARSYFFQLHASKDVASVDFLDLLQKSDGKRFEAVSAQGKLALASDLLETFRLLYAKTKDPFWLYRSGQIAVSIRSTAEAFDFFKKAYAEAPVDACYRLAAYKQVQNLANR